jgi:hypothetical protein
LDRFSRLQSDYRWILTHKKQLREEYANKYIAVQNETVRFTGNTIEDLIAAMKSNNAQVDNFAIEYVSKHPVDFLL